MARRANLGSHGRLLLIGDAAIARPDRITGPGGTRPFRLHYYQVPSSNSTSPHSSPVPTIPPDPSMTLFQLVPTQPTPWISNVIFYFLATDISIKTVQRIRTAQSWLLVRLTLIEKLHPVLVFWYMVLTATFGSNRCSGGSYLGHVRQLAAEVNI